MAAPSFKGSIGNQPVSFPVKYNPDYNNRLKQIFDFNDQAAGAFRGVQLLERITRAVKLFFEESRKALAMKAGDLNEKFSTYTKVAALPRLPQLTCDGLAALTSLNDLSLANLHKTCRTLLKKITDAFTAVEYWGYAGMLLSSAPMIKNITDCVCFIESASDLMLTYDNYCVVSDLTASVDGGINGQQLIAENQTLLMVKIAKALIAVATAVLAVLSIAYGALLGAEASLALACASTLSGICTHFYEKSMEYKISF